MVRNEQGFTLLELMTVVAVLGILAAFSYPSVTRMLNRQAAKVSGTQVAGLLAGARAQALTEGTPHLVYFDTPAPGEDGACTAMATEVRDADHSYSITPGDSSQEFQLEGRACTTMKPFAQDPNEPGDLAAVPLPGDDLAARAPDAAAVAAERAKSNNGNGKGKAKGAAKKAARTATVAETVINGATFPVDADGRAVVAFSERGIPVDPSNPTSWGSGAGGVYLTDGEGTLIGALVAPLGDIQLRLFDLGTGSWQ